MQIEVYGLFVCGCVTGEKKMPTGLLGFSWLAKKRVKTFLQFLNFKLGFQNKTLCLNYRITI